MSNPEIHQGSAEHITEIQKAAAERAAELQKQSPEHDKHLEAQAEKQAAEARLEAEKQATPAEEYRPASEKENHTVKHTIKARDPEHAYKKTMATIQREMSAPERAFSKVIHNKVVEKVSDVAGSTVARPNAIMSGALCALLLVGAVYLHARHFGYALSGSETMFAFLLGWAVGIAFDFIRAMITGKR